MREKRRTTWPLLYCGRGWSGQGRSSNSLSLKIVRRRGQGKVEEKRGNGEETDRGEQATHVEPRDANMVRHRLGCVLARELLEPRESLLHGRLPPVARLANRELDGAVGAPLVVHLLDLGKEAIVGCLRVVIDAMSKSGCKRQDMAYVRRSGGAGERRNDARGAPEIVHGRRVVWKEIFVRREVPCDVGRKNILTSGLSATAAATTDHAALKSSTVPRYVPSVRYQLH